MAPPNIFSISSKELTQDAFVVWLLGWAHDDFKNSHRPLHVCGKEMLQELLSKQSKKVPDAIRELKICRQYQNIDIWVEVNNTHLLMIEDKVFANEHGEQLMRYREIAKTVAEDKGWELVCIFMKTGTESKNVFEEAAEKGYAAYTKQDFLSLVRKHKDIENDIFKEFSVHLEELENLLRFEKVLLENWEYDQWLGFFENLNQRNVGIRFHRVNNPSGGFWNYLLTWEYWGPFPVYIQLEQNWLTFKISTDPADAGIEMEGANRSHIRNKYHEALIQAAKKHNDLHIKRPQSFGKGTWMTLARVAPENWLGTSDKTINFKTALNNIEHYIALMRKMALETPPEL